MRRSVVLLVGGLAWLGSPSPASATWSVVGVDPETQEVGVAVASCVDAPLGTTILPQVAGLAPGVGALAVQALWSQSNRDQALALLEIGTAPQDIIDTMVAGDPSSATRQYGVVTLDGQLAAFTGAATQRWAGDAQGLAVTVQGNILYGPEVVDDALAAFGAEAPRCPWTLADRLMLALEAGAVQGGDNRCSEEQSALAAVIQVARADDEDGTFTLDLRVPSQPLGGDNPVTLLRAAYDQWRLENPPDDSECGGGSESTGGAGSSDSTTGSASSTGAADGTHGHGSSSGSSAGSDSPADGGESSGTGASTTGETEAGGCGCSSTGGSWIALALGGLLLVTRRPTRPDLR